MKLVNKLMIAVVVLGMTVAFGQDSHTDFHNVSIVIPNVALLDIEGASKDISLAFDAPTEAGNGLADKSDNSLWLNVTSIVALNATRNISVRVNAPLAGLNLNVEASGYSGSGFGSFGTPSGEVTLSGSDQTLVSGIRSGYTFNGANNGYQLNYAVSPIAGISFGDLVSGTESVEVTYTLTN